MENVNLKKYGIYEIIFISVLSTLLHFVFDIFNENVYIGAFVPVNESVWEHLKMPTFAIIISYIIFHRKLKTKRLNLFELAISIFIPIILIPVIFYIAKDIFKVENMVIDIVALYFSIILSVIVKYMMIKSGKFNNYDIFGTFLIFTVILTFVIFTYVPPKLGIFKDTVNNIYGLNIY